MAKSIEELREISTKIVNEVLGNKLTVEEGIYVIENAKTFLLMVKIVGDFDGVKKRIEAVKAKRAVEKK